MVFQCLSSKKHIFHTKPVVKVNHIEIFNSNFDIYHLSAIKTQKSKLKSEYICFRRLKSDLSKTVRTKKAPSKYEVATRKWNIVFVVSRMDPSRHWWRGCFSKAYFKGKTGKSQGNSSNICQPRLREEKHVWRMLRTANPVLVFLPKYLLTYNTR